MPAGAARRRSAHICAQTEKESGLPPSFLHMSLPVADVDPLVEEFLLLRLALDGLRSRDDGKDALNVLDRRIRLGAEQLQVLLRKFILALQFEDEVRPRRIGRAVALRRMRPVDDIRRAVGRDDHIAGLEVAVAELVVAGQTVEAHVQVIADRCGICACRDLHVHLVAQMPQKGYALRTHADLQVDEEVEVLILFLGMLVHERLQRLAVDVFPDQRPSAFHNGDAQDLGNIQFRLLDARLVERLVEDARFGVALVKGLDEPVAVAVEFLAHAFMNEFHSYNIPPYRRVTIPQCFSRFALYSILPRL